MQYIIVKFKGQYKIIDLLSYSYYNFETFKRFNIQNDKRVYVINKNSELLERYVFSSEDIHKSILPKIYLGMFVFGTHDIYELIDKYNELTKK